MKSFFRIACLGILLALCGGITPALAQRLTSADAKAIRTVIEAQLDAFARDDADKAFSYAAPPIRTMFGSAANFMRMVKTGYPVVYRPVSVTFLKPEAIDGEVMQAVQMTDDAGQVWVAHYRMLRQKAKPWLINGCQLERSDARIT
jgi:hypothetical protein